jgi:hypothetical protein
MFVCMYVCRVCEELLNKAVLRLSREGREEMQCSGSDSCVCVRTDTVRCQSSSGAKQVSVQQKRGRENSGVVVREYVCFSYDDEQRVCCWSA